MKILAGCVAVLVTLTALSDFASATDRANRVALRHARSLPWHGDYYYTPKGVPISLVVPPNAHMQVKMGWGVAQTDSTPIYHQFYRAYPGGLEGAAGARFQPTPQWPSHTDQFGVYYVRGPW